MKRISAVFLVLTMMLCACGGTDAPRDTETLTATAAFTEPPTEAPTEISTEVPTETGLSAGPVIATGDGVLESGEQLWELALWLQKINSLFMRDQGSYEFIRDYVGVEAEDRGDGHLGVHSYAWYSPDKEQSVLVKLKENWYGLWTYDSCAPRGFTLEELPADLRPTFYYGETGFYGEMTWPIRFEDSKSFVTVTLPRDSSWVPSEGSMDVILFNAPGGPYSSVGSPCITISIADSLENINYSLGNCEEVRSAPGRTIGGIEMEGRTFREWGQPTTEYYGELPGTGWFSVKLVELDERPGSAADAMVESIRFS